MCAQLLPILFALAFQTTAGCDSPKTIRYVKPVAGQYRLETEFRIDERDGCCRIKSVTHRGSTRLTLCSESVKGRLRCATVSIRTGAQEQTVTARVNGGQATVQRHDGTVNTFDCPAGVIVTSAPDWTDCVLLMRRFDATTGRPQQFPGLWIHPTRKPLRVTFKVIPTGTDVVARNGMRHILRRFRIVLRNGSHYVAWRDCQRRLIRLVPDRGKLPAMVLEGWENTTAGLSAAQDSRISP